MESNNPLVGQSIPVDSIDVTQIPATRDWIPLKVFEFEDWAGALAIDDRCIVPLIRQGEQWVATKWVPRELAIEIGKYASEL